MVVEYSTANTQCLKSQAYVKDVYKCTIQAIRYLFVYVNRKIWLQVAYQVK